MKKYFVVVEWKGIINANTVNEAWNLALDGPVRAEGMVLVEEMEK